MKKMLFPSIVICLLVVVSAEGQAEFRVNEASISAKLSERMLLFEFPIQSNGSKDAIRLRVELLDPEDRVVAVGDDLARLRRGPNVLKPILVVPEDIDLEPLLWQRIRYTIGEKGSEHKTSGVVSISEIVTDIFELQVTIPQNVIRGVPLHIHATAIHPGDLRPIRDVEVQGEFTFDSSLREESLKVVARGRTNRDGIATLILDIPFDAEPFADGDITVIGRKNGFVRSVERSVEVESLHRAFIYTDKSLYQPGQTVHLRGLLLNPQKRPIGDRELSVSILNEKYDTILQGRSRTSRFGAFSLEWALPENLILGKYVVQVEEGNLQVGHGQFTVLRYEMPNFVVNVSPDKRFYLPDEKFAEVEISAEYLFGKPVIGGIVKVDDTDGIIDPAEVMVSEETRGYRARIDLSMAHDELLREKVDVYLDKTFIAYLTDPTTNRTESRRFVLRVTKEPIHVYFVRFDTEPSHRVPFQFYVSTFYADGTPVQCDITIEGHYENAINNEVLAKARTNRDGISKFEISLPERPFVEAGNRFTLRFNAKDRKGQAGTNQSDIGIRPDSKSLYLRTDRTVYAPDQPINVSLFSTEAADPIRVDIVKDSVSLLSQIVRPRNGRASISIPFRADFHGELVVSGTLLHSDGFRNSGSYSRSVIYPSPSMIDLSVSALRASYKPGEQARAVFSSRILRSGTETALGVFVVDKAIEERARIERVDDNLSDLRHLLGIANSVGGLTRRDLDMVDTSRPIPAETQLAAEFLLSHLKYRLESRQSLPYFRDFADVYAKHLRAKLQPVISFLEAHFEKTGDIPNDLDAVRSILAESGVDTDILLDPWHEPYQVRSVKRWGLIDLEFVSASADKIHGTDDDFQAAKAEFRWFSHTLRDLDRAIQEGIRDGLKPPDNERELAAAWETAGIGPERLVDLWGNPVFITRSVEYTRTRSKASNFVISEFGGEKQSVRQTSIVEEDLVIFRLWSKGEDGKLHTSRDFELGQISVVLRERVIATQPANMAIDIIPRPGAGGAISGTVVDMYGAVVVNAEITVFEIGSIARRSAKTNNRGEFELTELPAGKYSVRATSPGFTVTEIINIIVADDKEVKLVIQLEVGGLSEEVVVAARQDILNTSNASLSHSVTSVEMPKSIAAVIPGAERGSAFTPRVREYFPETLFWEPELVTDTRGRAEVNFRLGDSLTTWKLYAFGSTADGKFGMTEKEFLTFQPLMAELEPPKILTVGDEISLPVPIRNYTDRRQSVSVRSEPNNWSTLIGANPKVTDVEANSSENVIFTFRADVPIKEGRKRVVAAARGDGDAIEKPVTVKPDGFQTFESQAKAFRQNTVFGYSFPETALEQNRKVEVKIYPNLLSNIVGSADGLLQRPYGCGEQTVSSTYPNLLILKAFRDLGIRVNSDVKTKAQRNLLDGYERLLLFQTESGGFSYWGRSDRPVAALTAFAISFLSDASDFIEVDEAVIIRATDWLAAQQNQNGSWMSGSVGGESSTAFIVRSLLSSQTNSEPTRARIIAGFEYLDKNLETIDSPFVLASFALSANELGRTNAARRAVKRLAKMTIQEGDILYWKGSSTPFFGWGRAAEIESTALAMRAIIEIGLDADPADSAASVGGEAIASGALMYLLLNKDKFGVWHSTQTTVNVLDALIALQKSLGTREQKDSSVEVMVNGQLVKRLSVDLGVPTAPIIVDVSAFLERESNKIEIVSTTPGMLLAQSLAEYYVEWQFVRLDSKYFDLKVSHDKTTASVGETIQCEVGIVPKATDIRGMVIAEIGIPPGSDIERESLEAAIRGQSISRYDILPDRVVVYMWARAGGTKFSFKFRPRYGINAQTPASVVYDYYNPEAQAVVPPIRFMVR